MSGCVLTVRADRRARCFAGLDRDVSVSGVSLCASSADAPDFSGRLPRVEVPGVDRVVLEISELFECGMQAGDRAGIPEMRGEARLRARQRGVPVGSGE